MKKYYIVYEVIDFEKCKSSFIYEASSLNESSLKECIQHIRKIEGFDNDLDKYRQIIITFIKELDK